MRLPKVYHTYLTSWHAWPSDPRHAPCDPMRCDAGRFAWLQIAITLSKGRQADRQAKLPSWSVKSVQLLLLLFGILGPKNLKTFANNLNILLIAIATQQQSVTSSHLPLHTHIPTHIYVVIIMSHHHNTSLWSYQRNHHYHRYNRKLVESFVLFRLH